MRLDVDTTGLRSAGEGFTVAGLEVRAATARLSEALAALGSPWGRDREGSEFASSYQAGVAGLVQAAGAVAAGVLSVGDGVQAMADNHQRTDEGIAASLQPDAR